MYFRNSVSHLRAKCSREGAEIAELALNLHAPMVVLLPAFSGMFVALTLTTSLWSQAEWDTDAASMRLAGFTTLIIPHTGKQLSAPTALCPQGTFETWYPVSPAAFNGTGAACFTEVGDVKAEGGTLGNVLRAAKRYNLTVSLGLMFAPAEHGFPSQHRNGTYRNWGDFQGRQVAPYLHRLYHGGGQPASGNDTPITPIDGGQLQRLGSTATSNSTSTTRRRSTHDAYAPIAGIYTEIEFANSDAWMDAMQSFGRDYIGGIARGVHDLTAAADPSRVGVAVQHLEPNQASRGLQHDARRVRQGHAHAIRCRGWCGWCGWCGRRRGISGPRGDAGLDGGAGKLVRQRARRAIQHDASGADVGECGNI